MIDLTTKIVAAYVRHNSLATTELSDLIKSVYAALLATTSAPETAAVPQAAPAVPVKKSITPDFIVCLEDGKKLKMLKRHLRTAYNMSPDEYRAKWGLPATYPMVAPDYAATRSSLAKKAGLGLNRRTPETLAEKPKRGRKKAAAE